MPRGFTRTLTVPDMTHPTKKSIPVGFGKTLGIIVVDFQKAFTRPGGALAGSPHIEAAVEATQRLLTHARAAGVRVAVSYVAYATLDAMPHWKVRAVKTDLFRGMPGSALSRHFPATTCTPPS